MKIRKEDKIQAYAIEYDTKYMMPIKVVFQDKYEIEFTESMILRILQAYIEKQIKETDGK